MILSGPLLTASISDVDAAIALRHYAERAYIHAAWAPFLTGYRHLRHGGALRLVRPVPRRVICREAVVSGCLAQQALLGYGKPAASGKISSLA